jgi:hypothetical protein
MNMPTGRKEWKAPRFLTGPPTDPGSYGLADTMLDVTRKSLNATD